MKNQIIRNSNRLSVIIIACLCLLLLAEIYAQEVPPSVQPGRIEQQFKPTLIPQSGGDPIAEDRKLQDVPEGAEGIEFELQGLLFEYLGPELVDTNYQGVYSIANFQSDIDLLVGTRVSINQLYELANKITIAYRNNGFVLSRAFIPAQEIGKEGIVTINIIEGFIHDIKFNNVGKKSIKQLRRYTDKIKADRPLTTKALERYMLLLNDLTGVAARATLSPSSVAGAADLTIVVDEQAYNFSLLSNNRGSNFIGPYQFTGQLTLNKLGSLYRPTSLTMISTGNDELVYGFASHSIPIGGEGLKLNATASRSNSKPGGLVSIFDIDTDTWTAGLGFSYPLIRSRTKNLLLRSELSFYESESDRLGNAVGSELINTEDNVRSLRLGVTFDNIDALYGINLVDVEISQGLDLFNASKKGDDNLTRALGDPEYTKVNLYAARLQSLSSKWSLLAAANGQYAFDDLLSSEQYGVGGAQFVRGYDSSEIVGDSGYSGKLELRFNSNSTFGWLNDYMAYGFVDGGKIDRKSPASGESDSNSIYSAGVGIRFRMLDKITGYLELAAPLSSDLIAAEGDDDPRLFFQIGRSF